MRGGVEIGSQARRSVGTLLGPEGADTYAVRAAVRYAVSPCGAGAGAPMRSGLVVAEHCTVDASILSVRRGFV